MQDGKIHRAAQFYARQSEVVTSFGGRVDIIKIGKVDRIREPDLMSLIRNADIKGRRGQLAISSYSVLYLVQ